MRVNPVLSRAVLSTGGMAVQGVARFVYTLVIGNVAGLDTMGEVTTVLSLAVYLALVWPAGAGIAATRYLSMPEVAAQALRPLIRSWWIASTGLAAIAIPLTLLIVNDPAIAISSALLVFGYNAYVFTRGVLTGEDRLLWAAIADTLSSLLAITALVLVVTGNISWALLLPLTLGYLLFAAVSLPRTRSTTCTKELRGEVLRFTREASLGVLVTGGLLPATMVFVRAFDTPANAGLFAAALTLATPANMISQALNQVLIPHFTRISDARARHAAHTRVFLLSTLLFAMIFGILIVLAPWLLQIFREDASGGTTAMQILLVIVFLFSIAAVPSALLLSDGRQRLYAKIWVVSFAVGTVIMALCAPLWGQWGALLGYGIGGGGGAVALIIFALLPHRIVTSHPIAPEEEHQP